jgi:hypothetical protein
VKTSVVLSLFHVSAVRWMIPYRAHRALFSEQYGGGMEKLTTPAQPFQELLSDREQDGATTPLPVQLLPIPTGGLSIHETFCTRRAIRHPSGVRCISCSYEPCIRNVGSPVM